MSGQMRSIVGMKTPYREIPKLPELREKFMSLYNEILEEQSAPVVKPSRTTATVCWRC